MPVPPAPPLNPADFANECVNQGLRFGVHPHYLVGVAQLRSNISDAAVDSRIGPFRLTQTEWDANSSDENFGITDFESADVNDWDMQCCIYALMALRAQNQSIAQLGRLPSAVELYQAQWPNDPALAPASMQAALDQTSALMATAFTQVLGAPLAADPTIGAQDSTSNPAPDHTKPVPTAGTDTFLAKAPSIMARLIADFGLKDFQAAGLMGNIGEECDGFREMQEKKPIIPGSPGGFGWAQWTGPRRTLFEGFCSSNGLTPFSDAANYGFLKQELNTTQSMSLTAIQKASSISKAVRTFEATFERAKAGLEHFDRRDQWADLSLRTFRASTDTMVPSAVMSVLDPDLIPRVVAKANLANASYWVVDQFSDEGGQVLVKQESGKDPVILVTDTTIFPLKAGLVPANVAAKLSADFDANAVTPAPAPVPAAASEAEIAARIFAEAKQCDETLVTRDAPNTNHGRLACAYAVNKVVSLAIGRPVGGGLSTADMGEVLANTDRQVPEQQITSGMIIISPTHGGNVGHVGIVGELKTTSNSTVIYSNSSSRGVFSTRSRSVRGNRFIAIVKGFRYFSMPSKSRRRSAK